MYMALPEPTSLSLHDALPILHSFHEPGDEVVDELFRGDRGGPLTGRVLLLLGHPGVDRALDEADRALGPQLRCRDLVVQVGGDDAGHRIQVVVTAGAWDVAGAWQQGAA